MTIDFVSTALICDQHDGPSIKRCSWVGPSGARKDLLMSQKCRKALLELDGH